MRWSFTLSIVLFAACAGCSSAPSGRAPLTERQRDSVLARSGLPGATVVGRALEAGDRAAGHAAGAAAVDSLFR